MDNTRSQKPSSTGKTSHKSRLSLHRRSPQDSELPAPKTQAQEGQPKEGEPSKLQTQSTRFQAPQIPAAALHVYHPRLIGDYSTIKMLFEAGRYKAAYELLPGTSLLKEYEPESEKEPLPVREMKTDVECYLALESLKTREERWFI